MALRILRQRSRSSANQIWIGYSPRCSRSLPDRSSIDRFLGWSLDGGRSYFTATQAAAALRPFYFAVHPDLFGLYPDMYKTNEQSLKALNGYIDGLYASHSSTSPSRTKPVSLKFYVRDRKSMRSAAAARGEKSMIRSVQVNLKERDPCAAVRSILESCELPTEHLPQRWNVGGKVAKSAVRYDTTAEAVDDYELMRFWASKKKKAPEFAGLRDWLTKMTPHVNDLRAQQEKLEKDVKRKIDETKIETGLIDIDFNLSWTLTHCRGCLQLFRRALTTSGVPTINLKGWTLKFGRHGSYVSLDRSVVLGVDDLPADWMHLIQNLNPPHAYYGDLPDLERKLSDALGGASIVAVSDARIREYKNQLIRLTDRLGKSETWKSGDWSKLRLIIENEAGGLILLENGHVSVPSNVHPQTLRDFLEENAGAAVALMETYGTTRRDLEELRDQCLIKWNLEEIDWGDLGDVSHYAVKTCLERLLDFTDQEEIDLRDLLRGHRLHVGPQEAFVVLPDGRLSIPCDWKL